MQFKLRLNILFLVLSCIAYCSVFISPATLWFTGFLALGIPFLLIIHLFFSYLWLKNGDYKYFLIPFTAFILGANQINRTLSFDTNTENILTKDEDKLKVLSSNVRVFNVYEHLHKDNPESPEKQISWLSDNQNNIICLQEYYNEKGNKTFHTSKRFQKSYPYQYVKASSVNRIGAEFGVAIFSKYKILNRGEVVFNKASHNQAIYADVDWNGTIVRIFNIHLESMRIPDNELFDGDSDHSEIKKVGKDTYRRLRRGFKARANQSDLILEEIKKSPFPIILCGDLNDLPYSYTYQSLKNQLNNAFEEKGMGFGVTYNGKIPFLRIDNQFFSDQFTINKFKVHRDINYSDHFPISAEYELNK